MADIHLGAHREAILQELELKSFNEAMDKCMEIGVDFVLISGDLFHVGIPDLGVVNYAVRKMRNLRTSGIQIYAIYGSHDYNPASTSVIDVMETAGILTNVAKMKNVHDRIKLDFFTDSKTGAKITGISARKIGLESKQYSKLDRESLEHEKGFKIFAFHSGITEFKPPNLSEMETIPLSLLPKGFDYYAGGHIHERGEFNLPSYERIVFPGPLFTGYGRDIEITVRGEKRGFYLVDFEDRVNEVEFVEVKSFEGAYLEYDVTGKNSLHAGKELQLMLNQLDVSGKVVALKIKGELSGGKTSDINFTDIKGNLIGQGATYVYLNRHNLTSKEFGAIKSVEEDSSTIEKRTFMERVNHVKVSQDYLSGDKGASVAQELLKVLRQNAKVDESKKVYQERILSDSIEVLKLKQMIEAR
jgi:DNA repair exonuclease SbcCD nuclease subunit